MEEVHDLAAAAGRIDERDAASFEGASGPTVSRPTQLCGISKRRFPAFLEKFSKEAAIEKQKRKARGAKGPKPGAKVKP